MDCKDAQALVHGYLDGELKPAETAALSAHLAACAECRRFYNQQQALRAALKKYTADCFPVPQELHARILNAIAAEEAAPRFHPFSWDWLRLGAVLAGTVILTWSLTYYLVVPSQDERFADEAIASHLRSLLIGHLTDIHSSDPATVQGWFADKLDFVPSVKELSSQGFTLVGGRLDYMYDQEVASVVYRRGQEAINLFIWPAKAMKNTALRPISDEGYSILVWTEGGINFCSISKLDEKVLTEFAKAYRARAG